MKIIVCSDNYAYVCNYYTLNGSETKSFSSMKDAFKFCEKLDRQIERGTCSGYMLSIV